MDRTGYWRGEERKGGEAQSPMVLEPINFGKVAYERLTDYKVRIIVTLPIISACKTTVGGILVTEKHGLQELNVQKKAGQSGKLGQHVDPFSSTGASIIMARPTLSIFHVKCEATKAGEGGGARNEERRRSEELTRQGYF